MTTKEDEWGKLVHVVGTALTESEILQGYSNQPCPSPSPSLASAFFPLYSRQPSSLPESSLASTTESTVKTEPKPVAKVEPPKPVEKPKPVCTCGKSDCFLIYYAT